MSIPIFLDKQAFTYIEYRLERKLPIQTTDDITYVRKRFRWVVEKFKEQYFNGGQKIDTTKYFSEIFEVLMIGIDNLDLSKLHDFKKGLASSMILVAKTMGCSLKVDKEFFIDQFLRVIDQRFYRQRHFITQQMDFLRSVLIDAGAEDLSVLKIIETGVSVAETYAYYEYSLLEYIIKTIGGIVEECKRLKIFVTHEMLLSEEVKEMAGGKPPFMA